MSASWATALCHTSEAYVQHVYRFNLRPIDYLAQERLEHLRWKIAGKAVAEFPCQTFAFLVSGRREQSGAG